MSFTINIPFPGETLGQSRQQVLDNFLNYFNTMSVNHVAPNASGQGKHKFVTMPVQSPNPANPLAGEGLIFTKTLNAESRPYYMKDASATTTPLMPIKAMAFVLATGAGITFPGTNSYGINTGSSVRTGVGQYTIVLALNAVSSANVAILLTPMQNGPVVATYNTPTFLAGVLTIPVKMWKAETAGNFIESSFSITVTEFV